MRSQHCLEDSDCFRLAGHWECVQGRLPGGGGSGASESQYLMNLFQGGQSGEGYYSRHEELMNEGHSESEHDSRRQLLGVCCALKEA